MAATILCIDDEALLREDIVEELEDEGYRVLQASDGHEGLKQILQHHPDLVICDITMPRKNGYELLKEVRGDDTLSRTPFIMVTAESKTENVIAAKKAGVNNYIVKPFNAQTLKGKINAVFGES